MWKCCEFPGTKWSGFMRRWQWRIIVLCIWELLRNTPTAVPSSKKKKLQYSSWKVFTKNSSQCGHRRLMWARGACLQFLIGVSGFTQGSQRVQLNPSTYVLKKTWRPNVVLWTRLQTHSKERRVCAALQWNQFFILFLSEINNERGNKILSDIWRIISCLWEADEAKEKLLGCQNKNHMRKPKLWVTSDKYSYSNYHL